MDDPSWSKPWHSLIHCSDCNALLKSSERCPVCGWQLDTTPERRIINGVEVQMGVVVEGAIPWPTSVLLGHMRQEWSRPGIAKVAGQHEPSERLVIVILFWTLFEVLVDRFYQAALADLPGELCEELLQRFPTIGGRLDRLYKRIWQTTFWVDLEAEGFAEAAHHLRLVQERRNAFVHRDPSAIDDELVRMTVERLAEVQSGWIALFNKRCTRRVKRVPIWEGDLALMTRKKPTAS